jgi:hypothetical protein
MYLPLYSVFNSLVNNSILNLDRLVTHSNGTVKKIKICAPGLKSYKVVGETSLSAPVSTELFFLKNPNVFVE